MIETAKYLKVTGIIGCLYIDLCPSNKKCGRVGEKPITQVRVDPNSEDLSDAAAEAEKAAQAWSEVPEGDCIRGDNVQNGKPVAVFRIESYLTERVY